MSSLFLPRFPGRRHRPALALGSILLLVAVTAARGADSSAVAKLDYSGDQTAVQAIDREIADVGRDPAKLHDVAGRLLLELRQSNLTFAARQAVCQRLGYVLALAPADLPPAGGFAPLRRMLTSERDVDLARLALEPVPGAFVDQLFLDALRNSEGHVRVALVQSIGARRIPAGVSALKPLLGDADPLAANAAAYALGQIGTPEALAALRAAPNPAAAPVVTALLALAPRLPGPEAAALADALRNDSRVSPVLRAAALRAAIEADSAAATPRIIAVLGSADWPAKETAIESIAASTAPGLVAALAAKLPAWDPPTQAAVIAALGRKADPAALPAILGAVRHESADVRAAAIAAAALLPGTPDTVRALIPVAAGEDTELAKQARLSVARLNGPEIDATITDGAEHAAPPLRPAFIEQIALRNLTAALPILHAARQAPEPAVRSAAVNALGEIAPASEQGFVLDWALHAADPDEQTRALRAVVAITKRNPDTANRSLPVIQAIEQAEPAAAAKAIPVLARLEDRASAEAAGRLALRDDPAIATAATAALSRWNDRTVLPVLATIAEKAPAPANRKTAFTAAYRLLERTRSNWSEELTAATKRLCQAAPDVKSRQQMIRMLGHARDNDALAYTETLAADAEVAADAQYAMECIRASQAGPMTFRASASTNQLKNLTDGKTSSRWSVPAERGQWLEIDFKRSRPVSRLTLDQSGRAGDFPPGYEVYVADDAQHPGSPVVSGPGHSGDTVIQLPANTRGRFVILKLTGERTDSSWTICELTVD